MKKILHITIFLLIVQFNVLPVLVQGDPLAADGETFSFDVGFGAFDAGSETSAPRLWIANNDATMNSKDDTVKPYGMCYINQFASFVPSGDTPKATPMTNQEAATIYSFDGTTIQIGGANPNPMWGAQFSLFGVTQQHPYFVLTNTLNLLYVVQDIQRYTETNPDKANVTKLLSYDCGAGEEIAATLGFSNAAGFNNSAGLNNAVFWVAHATGTFGATTSKIATILKSSQVVDGQTIPYLYADTDTTISTSTNALKGGASGNNLAALGSSVTFCYGFNRLFIGLDTTANGAAGSCGTALTFATYSPGVLIFNAIAPASLLTTGIDTVISAAAGNRVRITNATSMMTSTGLSYLIVSRDDGVTSPTIYALPIIISGVNTGQIADFSSINNKFYKVPAQYVSRQFDTVVSSIDDIDPAGPYAAQLLVGTSTIPALPDFPLQRLYVVGDCVYATLGDSSTPEVPYGTYKSQAIFAQDGHIVEWSEWQQVLGSEASATYSFVDGKTITGYYVNHVTNGTYRAVNQTTFSSQSFIQPLLSQSPIGGIQGLFNFGEETTGFACAYAMMIATGFEYVGFGQTGTYDAGYHIINNPVTTAFFFGDDVNNQQALIAAEIAHDTDADYHWIFVGGDTGVSVLTNDDTGITWNGNLTDITGLQAGQTFKKIGNFSYVKKLVWDASSTYLYVVTSSQLYRIALDPNKFTATPTVDLNPELLLDYQSFGKMPTYFLDMIIDDNFCIIGTTNGMYSVDFSSGVGLQKIPVPSGLPAVSQLTVISSNAQPQRYFKTLSNLIVLNNTFGSQQARINRFAINNGTIIPFDDFLIGTLQSNDTVLGTPTSLVKFDNYISSYFTDGSWNLGSCYYLGLTQPSNNNSTPSVLQLYSGIHAGFSSSKTILPAYSSYAPLSFINQSNMAGFVRETTSGALIAYGNFTSMANT